MKLLSDNSKESLFKDAANIIEDSIKELIQKKDKKNIIIAIPGGRSMPPIFNELEKKDLPWEQVHFFIVDERMVPITHEDSNARLAKENIIDTLIEEKGMPAKNFHPFIINEEEKDKGLLHYAEELKGLGGKFDIVLLSSGEDGHVAGLYPGHHSIKNDSEFFIKMHDSPKPPKDRMSSSRKLINSSEYAILLFIGEGKKEALTKFKKEDVSVEECPAKLVNNINNVFVLTDLHIE